MQKTFCDDCGCDMSETVSCHYTLFPHHEKFYIAVKIMNQIPHGKFVDICRPCAVKLIREQVIFPDEVTLPTPNP
jgi:hypothetical protein